MKYKIFHLKNNNILQLFFYKNNLFIYLFNKYKKI